MNNIFKFELPVKYFTDLGDNFLSKVRGVDVGEKEGGYVFNLGDLDVGQRNFISKMISLDLHLNVEYSLDIYFVPIGSYNISDLKNMDRLLSIIFNSYSKNRLDIEYILFLYCVISDNLLTGCEFGNDGYILHKEEGVVYHNYLCFSISEK